MNFSNLIVYIDQFLAEKFDHGTLEDQRNNPFVSIWYLKTKGRVSAATYSFYVTPPLKQATYNTKTVPNLAMVQSLASMFLLQEPTKVQPIEQEGGYCSGFATIDNELFLCSVTTNADDAKWVCKTLLSQLEIFVDNPY